MRVLGEEHPKTLTSANNLASSLLNQGKDADDERILREVLEVQKRVLEAEHLHTLTTANNLAASLSGQRKYVEVEQMLVASLQRVLGPAHPDTLQNASSLEDVPALIRTTPPTKAAAPAAAAPVASAPAAVTTPPAASAGMRGTTQPLSRLRRVIAERMVESLQVSAQLTTVVEVDVTRIAALRDRAKADFEAREGVKLTFLPFFAKAAVEALAAYPSLNASIDQAAGTVTYHGEVNLGVAVDTDRGLLVPVVRDAGDLSVAGLARRITDLADRTRTNRVSPDELSGGTFTLTNTGSRGALFDTPIINQPQVAILGTGSVVKRPIVISDSGSDVIAIRSMVYLALTYDHRLVDGADAARFLTAVRARLEEGTFADVGA